MHFQVLQDMHLRYSASLRHQRVAQHLEDILTGRHADPPLPHMAIAPMLSLLQVQSHRSLRTRLRIMSFFHKLPLQLGAFHFRQRLDSELFVTCHTSRAPVSTSRKSECEAAGLRIAHWSRIRSTWPARNGSKKLGGLSRFSFRPSHFASELDWSPAQASNAKAPLLIKASRMPCLK